MPRKKAKEIPTLYSIDDIACLAGQVDFIPSMEVFGFTRRDTSVYGKAFDQSYLKSLCCRALLEWSILGDVFKILGERHPEIFEDPKNYVYNMQKEARKKCELYKEYHEKYKDIVD
tara:strand:- start:56 stop:403 length:348 start_codon:yes stop_codon:yes gene_type:complete